MIYFLRFHVGSAKVEGLFGAHLFDSVGAFALLVNRSAQELSMVNTLLSCRLPVSHLASSMILTSFYSLIDGLLPFELVQSNLRMLRPHIINN